MCIECLIFDVRTVALQTNVRLQNEKGPTDRKRTCMNRSGLTETRVLIRMQVGRRQQGCVIKCKCQRTPFWSKINTHAGKKMADLFADRTATQYMIGYGHHHVVRPSVCDAVHCGSRGQCSGLKVAPACS